MTNGYGETFDRWLGAMGWTRPGPDDIDATVERLAVELRQMIGMRDRARQMYRNGTPLSHLFAATVLGIEPDTGGQPHAGMRVDGTMPPAAPSDALVDARDRTATMPAMVREVTAAWAQLRADGLHSAVRSDQLRAALDALELATRQTWSPPVAVVTHHADHIDDDPGAADDTPNPGGDPDDYDRERGTRP